MANREELTQFLLSYKAKIREEAQKLMGEEMPELTESLFAQFETTGNRLNYETVYFRRRKFLTMIGMAAIIEKRDLGQVSQRTLLALSRVVENICAEECWAVPAHLSRSHPDWRLCVDLFASETAQSLGELFHWLKEDLPVHLLELIRVNVERRVLVPFFDSEQYGWEKSDHNWNAVCTGSIGSACIHIRGRSEETDRNLQRICDSLIYYIGGFAEDGTCMEGCSYFTYGMSYFVNFAQELFEYSNGRIDLLCGDWEHFRAGEWDKRGRIAAFQSKCFFRDGRTVNFSDGSSRARFNLGLNLALKNHYPEIQLPNLSCGADPEYDHCYRFVFRKMDVLETERWLAEDRDSARENAGASCCHILPDAQWCIANAENGVGMACKGGHNEEAHNHNDVGHLIYEGHGTTFLEDLGAGEYIRDYFGPKRYEILCNSSRGHSVPIVNGKGQLPGRQYRCSRFDADATRERVTVDMDISGAYGEKPGSMLRKLNFSLLDGELEVTDCFCFSRKQEVGENLITKIKPEQSEEGILLSDGRWTAVLIIDGVDHLHGVQVTAHPHSNHQGQPETVYAISWQVPLEDLNGTSRYRIKLMEEK